MCPKRKRLEPEIALTAEVIAPEDLGCESVKRMAVRDFAVTVAIDSRENDLYEAGREQYRMR